MISMRVMCLFLLCGAISIWPYASRRIFVASQNPQKLRAVQNALSQTGYHYCHGFLICGCYGVAAASNIAEQPVGYDAALKGARNRLYNIAPEKAVRSDDCIAIENYITQLSDGGWYDIGLVVHMHDGKEFITTTEPTYIPHGYVDVAYEQSHIYETGISKPVGRVIHEMCDDRYVDPQDWHRDPEFGGVSRQALCEHAVFKLLHADAIAKLNRAVTLYPDFPKPGVMFSDVTPIMSDGCRFATCLELMMIRYVGMNIDAVVGLESRGFIFGTALAREFGVGFVPIRKAGKLPGPTHTAYFEKEYGCDAFEIPVDVISPNERVLIVDDVIATGGSLQAAVDIVQQAGAQPVECVALSHVLPATQRTQRHKMSVPVFTLLDI